MVGTRGVVPWIASVTLHQQLIVPKQIFGMMCSITMDPDNLRTQQPRISQQ